MNKEDNEKGIQERGLKYIPYAVLGVLAVYMGWLRMFSYSSVVTEDGVFLSANDSWYHLRTVRYLVENYPAMFPFDVWTQFPYGSSQSTGFGGLFDQIAATAAMIVGLGNPSTGQVELIAAFAPVAFGVATVVPIYFIAKHITDKWFALVGALSLALVSGQFLNRTSFGNVQHQSAEAFFLAAAVLGFVIAFKRAYTEKPTVAHFRDNDWDGLRNPIVGSVLGGVALAAYMTTWPAGVYLVATLGIFVAVQMVRDHLNGDSTEYLAISTGFLFVVAAFLFFVYTALLSTQFLTELSGVRFSMLQVIALLGTGIGVFVLHFISEYLRSEDYDRIFYPVAVAGIAVFGVAILWLTGLIGLFENLIRRMYSFGYLTTGGATTIAEIQPPGIGTTISSYGALILLSFVGLALLLVRVVRKNRPVELVVLFWSLNMFSAYFTQTRFGYYMALAVSVTVSYAVYRVFMLADLDLDVSQVSEVKGYQIITVVMLFFFFIPILVVPVGGLVPAWVIAGSGAGGDMAWQGESLSWMEENTPEVPLEYNEPQPLPADMDFEYPEGAYGVLSWWDYGHWIMEIGNRIPNANPFQQGNQLSADFFTSQSEQRSSLILDAAPALEPDPNTHSLSDEELSEAADRRTEQQRTEDTRYVMIDDQMAGGKFGAIGTWVDFGQYVEQSQYRIGENQNATTPAFGLSDKYYNTTLARLYQDDADGMEEYRLVHETETYSLIGSIMNIQTGQTQQINRVVTRLNYDDDSIGFTPQDVSQIPDDQMIPLGGGSRYLYDTRGLASVKTFERVEGATITGEADVTEPTNVTAIAQMETTNTNRTFPYTTRTETDEDGSFEMTVPYPTIDDVPVEEGGTNASVEPVGSYEVFTGNVGIAEVFGNVQVVGSPDEAGQVDVRESDIYEGNEVEIELQEADTGGDSDEETGNETTDGTEGETVDETGDEGGSEEETEGAENETAE